MSGANSTPLGRMNPAIGAGKKPSASSHSSSSSSLLKPSYIMGEGESRGRSSIPSHLHGITGAEGIAAAVAAAAQAAAAAINASVGHNSKRDHDDDSNHSSNSESAADARKRRRKSRWQGDEKDKTFIPGMPTVLPSNMSDDQEEAYLLQLQIEEFSRRLRANDLGIPPNPEDRSPSPEPIYNNEGKRLNTREYRTRKKLEDDRHNCIQRMMKINTEYKPPADYKPPVVKVSDKVMIPQEEHPDINFVGLLIGPRGNTLKAMEKDTGAKIIIRGKGSVKEGKVGRKDGGPMPGEDEPLHAYVTAIDCETVKKGVDRIKEIIRQGVEVPEGQNDLRRMQLRELALLNGTLRENDGPRCSNCGSNAHKSWQCPDKPNVTNNVVCTSCGGTGHIARDCRQRRTPGAPPCVDRQKIDEEYMSLMAELGEGPPPPASNNQRPAGNTTQGPRPLFDQQRNAPRPLMAPPPRSEPQSMFPPGGNSQNQQGPGGPGPNGPGGPGGPNGQGNWNPSQYGQGGGGPPMMGGGGGNNGQAPNFNRPPPGSGGPGPGGPWQQQQQQGNNQQGPQGGQPGSGGPPGQFQGVPPPNLLGPPPPPPPATNGQQQHPNQQQQPSWMAQAPPGPPGGPQGGPGGPHGGPGGPHGGPHGPPHGPPPQMNHWQGPPPGPPGHHGPPGMGCPPPGPVPPPRPVGPPPGWGWNGPPQPVGPPPPPPGGPGGPGPRGPGGIDLGAILSAPPPPPPS